MQTKDVLLELRTKRNLTQDELAKELFVTRQAVSRWESGETVPNTKTLKLLSKFYDVSINTLLGCLQKLICQCCGMELDDKFTSREPDGTFNEEYCKWCYIDGKFAYLTFDELTKFFVENMTTERWPEEQVRAFCNERSKKLNIGHRKKLDNKEQPQIQQNLKALNQSCGLEALA